MKDSQDFRDSIATVDASGHRRWIFPRQAEGRYYRMRSWVSYALLLVLFVLPWIHVGGQPLFLFNVLERRFILFGIHFAPQDFYLFAIVMITAMVFIVLFTVVFGRLFCGWACPQTIFMEMVFRKIEYWIEGNANAQKRLAKADWTTDKIRKKVLKHGLFLLVSAAIAHTFLAYIIGTDELIATVSRSPLEAPGGFAAIVLFIGVFYAVFTYMREQVCIAVCPYGRLQGVLLDENSINVIYDYVRGEPRGKLNRGKAKKSSCSSCEACRRGADACSDRILQRIEASLSAAPEPKGDCIDCGMCVQVCPTGIDIRNGIQMECINCTACIDACDQVMDKVNRPRGLIRYDSERGVRQKERQLATPRVWAYSCLLLALLALNVFMLSGRDGLNVVLLRTPGTLYHREEAGAVSNLYTYQVVNNTGQPMPLSFGVTGDGERSIRMVGKDPVAQPGDVTEGALFVIVRAKGGRYPDEVSVVIYGPEGEIRRIPISFLHP